MSEASTKFVIDFVQQFGNLLQDTILKKNSADASISPIDTAISPISIFLCSLLAYPGMSGNTKKQFDDLFFELSSKVYPNGEISKTFLSDNLETGSLFTIIENIRKSLNIEKTHENKSEIKLSNTSYITDAEQPLKSFTDSSEKLGSIQRIDFNDTFCTSSFAVATYAVKFEPNGTQAPGCHWFRPCSCERWRLCQ